jgi:hypothetical protein
MLLKPRLRHFRIYTSFCVQTCPSLTRSCEELDRGSEVVVNLGLEAGGLGLDVRGNDRDQSGGKRI